MHTKTTEEEKWINWQRFYFPLWPNHKHSTVTKGDILLRQSCVFNPTLLSTVYKRKCLHLRGKRQREGVEEEEREGACEWAEQDSRRKKRDWDSGHLWMWKRAKPLPTEHRQMPNCLFLPWQSCPASTNNRLVEPHTKTQKPPRTNAPLWS